jgi:hypothetical protein
MKLCLYIGNVSFVYIYIRPQYTKQQYITVYIRDARIVHLFVLIFYGFLLFTGTFWNCSVRRLFRLVTLKFYHGHVKYD